MCVCCARGWWRREEGEKFNVWVAWLNLEAAKGAPSPGEAVSALFQRALQYTEPKKLYLALLGEQGGGSEGGRDGLRRCLARTGRVRRW